MTARLLVLALLLGACASGGSGPAGGDAVVSEAWVTASTPADDLDSLAVWKGPSGEEWVIATAKQTDRLAVFAVGTGAIVRSMGRPGSGPGEFERPNGVVVRDDLVFVVERDNRRVQILRLPGFTPVGSFGEGELRKPYGIAMTGRGPGRWEAWVTDDYPASNEEAPPLAELGERLRRYEVNFEEGRLAARFLGNAGATSGREALRKVESIEADPDLGRMLVADELDRDLEVYDLAGRPAGERVSGLFAADPEGIALYRCPGGEGYWITTEQQRDRTRFHVLDRRTLRPLGVFTGERTGNTDGIALTQETFSRFPHGALFALQNDQAVSAFDWSAVARALGLRADCALR